MAAESGSFQSPSVWRKSSDLWRPLPGPSRLQAPGSRARGVRGPQDLDAEQLRREAGMRRWPQLRGQPKRLWGGRI